MDTLARRVSFQAKAVGVQGSLLSSGVAYPRNWADLCESLVMRENGRLAAGSVSASDDVDVARLLVAVLGGGWEWEMWECECDRKQPYPLLV